MKLTKQITTIILTYNEQKHIKRCIVSAKKFSKFIYVIDSFSNDKTVKIAKSLGVKILRNKFVNYSQQFSWALENIKIKTPWTLRLDADEYLEENLIKELNQKLLSLPEDITGISFKLKEIFMNKWMRFGGRTLNLLRLWKTNQGYIENRWMDEHILLKKGKKIKFNFFFCNHNINDISFFISKHNWYASREAIDRIIDQHNLFNKKKEINKKNSTTKAYLTRLLKTKIYNNLPFGFGPFLYFIYRYVILFGFLDGKEGLIYHFLQAYWYRFLIETKIIEYNNQIVNIKKKKDKLKKLYEITGLKLVNF